MTRVKRKRFSNWHAQDMPALAQHLWLIKELALANIKTLDEANKFLREVYITKHNKKFAVQAKCSEILHKPIHDIDLDDIFCITHERRVQNDWTIRYENRILQIDSNKPAIVHPNDTVTVHERFNGKIFITIRTSKLDFKELERRQKTQTWDLDVNPICPHQTTNQYKKAVILACF